MNLRRMGWIMGLFLGLSWPSWSQNQRFTIIPQPQSIEAHAGSFILSNRVKLVLPAEARESLAAVEWLQQRVRLSAGFALEVTSLPATPSIQFKINANLPSEGYRLEVSPKSIVIEASQGRGHFYGVQTLLQLLPPAVFAGAGNQGLWMIPACVIEDAPRFAYRGVMLDVGRHFFGVDKIKQYIDAMALHKLNTLHWHLTEDQGWRIEIKKYPKLTEVGAFRKETMKGHAREQQWDGTPYGGFYTQDQIREIVAYAQSRYITIIPEIEMPGHALAALAAYPEFGCTKGPYAVGTSWGVQEDVFCPYEETFQFLEDVLTEVMDLFPSPYIHIGGDECPKTTWKNSTFCQDLIRREKLGNEEGLQSYFIKRMDAFLTKKGRKLIGWDEILEGGISPNATIMSWRGEEGGIAAVKEGHQAIMTPTSHVYLDYYQGDPATEPLAIGGYLPIEKVYEYEPIPAGLSKEEASRILGTQANVWTEYIREPGHLDYMTFPRATALAEVAWTQPNRKNYADFVRRLGVHLVRLESLGIQAAKRVYDLKAKTVRVEDEPRIQLQAADPALVIQVKSENEWKPYPAQGLPLVQSQLVEARVVDSSGKAVGSNFARFFYRHQATGLPYTLVHPPQRYTGGETYALTNGVTGNLSNYATWVGWNGQDAILTLDFGKSVDVSEVNTRYQQHLKSWILAPRRVQVEASFDGKSFRSIAGKNLLPKEQEESFVEDFQLTFPKVRTRYLRLRVEQGGKLPSSHPGAGQNSWLFLDEVSIK